MHNVYIFLSLYKKYIYIFVYVKSVEFNDNRIQHNIKYAYCYIRLDYYISHYILLSTIL